MTDETPSAPSPSSSSHVPGGEAGLPAEHVPLGPTGIAATAILAGMAGILIASIVGRMIPGTGGIASANEIAQHLTLWVTFVGAILAASEGRHLALAATTAALKGKALEAIQTFTALVSVTVTSVLTYAGAQMVRKDVDGGGIIFFGLPTWISELAIPIGFAGVTAWFVAKSAPTKLGKAISALGIPIAAGLYYLPESVMPALRWPLLGLILVAVALGAPIFVGIGGAALALFVTDEWASPVAIVPVSTFELVTKPELPMIPLLTFAGYLLAESKASERLLRVFRAVVGWMPGGLAIVTAAICAFFTTFTGGSGITILALGGLVLPALLQDRYPRSFSIGLVTASGSLGLLFPPSFPVILYAIVAQSVLANLPEAQNFLAPSIENLFVAGLLPGFLLLGITAAFGTFTAVRAKIPRPAFDWAEAKSAIWAAKWEVALPAVVLVAFFSGLTTLVEAAAVTVAYVYVIEAFVYRDLKPLEDLYRVGRASGVLVGGVLAILGVAFGLTGFLVDAEVPQAALSFFKSHVESPYVFLILLNGFLLVVGCLMDIFSAIMVVVPIISPIALAYGIDPVHLGIIFIANLELGYLTPPVGLNLFLSSFRFEEPLVKVYRDVIPFLLLLLAGVIAITYLPAMTTGFLTLFGPNGIGSG